MSWFWIVLVVFAAAVLVLAFALCRAAANGDAMSHEAYRRQFFKDEDR